MGLDPWYPEIILYLVSGGFNSADAQKIFSRFQLATREVAQDNPFRFYNEIYGIGFDKVKQFSSTLDFDDAENKYIVYRGILTIVAADGKVL